MCAAGRPNSLFIHCVVGSELPPCPHTHLPTHSFFVWPNDVTMCFPLSPRAVCEAHEQSFDLTGFCVHPSPCRACGGLGGSHRGVSSLLTFQSGACRRAPGKVLPHHSTKHDGVLPHITCFPHSAVLRRLLSNPHCPTSHPHTGRG